MTRDGPAGAAARPVTQPDSSPVPRSSANGSQSADLGAAATPLLEVRGLSKSFRGLQALVDYELRLAPLTIHGVIGPNGAGKTTLFHLLSGFLRPTSGTIAFEGRDITGSAAFKVSRLGIGRTFQNIRLFGELSVLDNVKIALQRQSRALARRHARLEPVVPARRAGAGRPRDGAARAVRAGRPARPIGAQPARTATSDGSRSRGPWASGPSSSCSTSRTRA